MRNAMEAFNAVNNKLSSLEFPFVDGNDKKAEAFLLDDSESASDGIYTMFSCEKYSIEALTDWEKGILSISLYLYKYDEKLEESLPVRNNHFWFGNPEFD